MGDKENEYLYINLSFYSTQPYVRLEEIGFYEMSPETSLIVEQFITEVRILKISS